MKGGRQNKKTPGSSNRGPLLRVCRLLNEQGAKYVVVGGYALSLHGLSRGTKDVDILIPRDVQNTAAVLEALKGLLWGIAGELDPEEITQKPFTIIGDSPRVDLLTVANKVKYEQARIKKARIDDILIPYVDFKTLLKTKDTDRLQDRADTERLKRIRSGKRMVVRF